jgi:hypothetical protein
MGIWNGIFGGGNSQAGAQQQQGQGAGQILVSDGTGTHWAQQLQGLYGGTGTVYAPPITYEPMYPIAITHRATGRKLIIWED